MRLLYLNHNVRGRGTYVRAFELGRQMVAAGHEVTLVTTSADARLRAHSEACDGVHVVEMPDLGWGPARTGWDPYNTLRRLQLVRSGAFDLVHAFDSRPAVILPALRVTRITGAPLVMDWADWWGRGGRIEERSGWVVRTFFGPVETWFEEAFRKRAAAATVICRPLGERLAALGYPVARILHVPNGCPSPTPVDRDDARRALGVAREEPLLVHVGVVMRPDLELLKAAFALARSRDPRLRLVLVGNTTRRPAELRAPGIEATGVVAERVLRQWVAAADAGVLPMHDTIGHRGRWPGKLSDYMAAGIPSVVTDVGDVAELVRGERAGWVADATATSLAAAIGAAIAAPDRAARGAAAAALARGPLSWRAVAATVEAFYGRVGNEWKAAA